MTCSEGQKSTVRGAKGNPMQYDYLVRYRANRQQRQVKNGSNENGLSIFTLFRTPLTRSITSLPFEPVTYFPLALLMCMFASSRYAAWVMLQELDANDFVDSAWIDDLIRLTIHPWLPSERGELWLHLMLLNCSYDGWKLRFLPLLVIQHIKSAE